MDATRQLLAQLMLKEEAALDGWFGLRDAIASASWRRVSKRFSVE
jgi:hypothetical protein